jgi:predicted DNA-binding WGR domain protein
MIMTLYRTSSDGSVKYYTMHDRQPLLTSRYALTLASRTGNGQERERIRSFETQSEMDAMIRKVITKKSKAGFTLLYSFMRGRMPESILGTVREAT